MMEFAPFYDVCGQAKSEYGFDIDVVTCGFQKKVSSAFWKTEIYVDKLITDIDFTEYDALAIPGGDHLYGFFEEAYDEIGGETKISKISTNKDEAGSIINKICVQKLIEELDEREKKIIILRYFKGKTQSEVAVMLGITQVQVSRIEKKILTDMRRKIA